MAEVDISNLMMVFFDPEEVKERHLNLYTESVNAPENFSKWFDDLVKAMNIADTAFK